jgi:hypothetical protein
VLASSVADFAATAILLVMSVINSVMVVISLP